MSVSICRDKTCKTQLDCWDKHKCTDTCRAPKKNIINKGYLSAETTLSRLENVCKERDFFRLQLQAIKRITEDTHKEKECAYTTLSRINELATQALRK